MNSAVESVQYDHTTDYLPHARHSVVDQWVRRVRQCKKSANNGCSVTIRLRGESAGRAPSVRVAPRDSPYNRGNSIQPFTLSHCVPNTQLFRVKVREQNVSAGCIGGEGGLEKFKNPQDPKYNARNTTQTKTTKRSKLIRAKTQNK